MGVDEMYRMLIIDQRLLTIVLIKKYCSTMPAISNLYGKFTSQKYIIKISNFIITQKYALTR